MHNNLLVHPIFTLRIEDEKHQMSLPQVLEALGTGRDLEFASLRRHQHHAWFSFLVQLGAIVCHRLERDRPDLSATEWATSLRELASSDEAWCLVVDDLSKPAFMQPPVPEGTLSVLKNQIPTPDALDVLIITRNHDLKRMTMRMAAAEHWAFSLISLQTMQGFLGSGNYGTSRMNGGFSSRPSVASAKQDDWCVRFQHEVPAILEHRKTLTTEDWPYLDSNGATLLWTLPWDGTIGLSLAELDPLYIEICRRVRLHGDRVGARAGTTKCARVEAKERFGDTGDFWTPLDIGKRKSLTVPATGFTYKLVSDIVFGTDWISAPAQKSGQDGPRLLVARVLVRGQGETSGYHERIIPIPGKSRRFFSNLEGEALLGARSREMIEVAGLARLKVLKPAVLVVAQGAPDKLKFDDKRFDKRLAEFDRRIDELFFPKLFRDIETDDDEARRAWHRILWHEVQELFLEIANSIPTPEARSYKARAQGDRTLHGSARKHLSEAFYQEANHATEQV